MSKISVNLPNSLERRLQELVEQEGISTDQFIATAVAEKMSALLTEEVLEQRGRRGSRAKYEATLSRVPDVDRTSGIGSSEHFSCNEWVLRRLKDVARRGANTFNALMEAVKVGPLGQITHAFFEVGDGVAGICVVMRGVRTHGRERAVG